MTTSQFEFGLVADYPDAEFDPHFVRENRHHALKRLEAGVPVHYAAAELTEPGVVAWLRALTDRVVAEMRHGVPQVRTGRSLLILGPTGTGKTHQAYAAVRALAHSGAHCRWQFTTAADAYARLRPRHRVDSEEEFARLSDTQLLVLDDLGAAKASEWTEEINYRLINHRYERDLPTLITSNVPPKDLAAALGERMTSRLAEMADRVVLRGDDRRRTQKEN